MPKDKFVQTKTDESKKIGKEKGVRFPRSVEPMVKITFKQNRKFNLHLGRQVFIFRGRESKEIPKELLEHKDFTDYIKQYFVIHNREVN